jgi:hypothetical protein
MHQGVVIGIWLADDVSAFEMSPAVLKVMPCEKTTGFRQLLEKVGLQPGGHRGVDSHALKQKRLHPKV